MNLPIAPVTAILLGGLAAFGIAAMPVSVLENLVLESGLPALLAAAEPPLGITARGLLALGGGGFAGGFAWLAGFLLFGSASLKLGGRRQFVARPATPDAVPAPVLRRADAHPDAPPRPPLLATRDLGGPFAEAVEPIEGLPLRPIEAGDRGEAAAPLPLCIAEPLKADPVTVAHVPAAVPLAESPRVAPPLAELPERPLPVDLDQPLAAFDPQSIPAVPMPPPIPAPRRQPAQTALFEQQEPFESFEFPAPELPAPAPRSISRPDIFPGTAAPKPEPAESIARQESEASVHALLDRLERGVVRRNQTRAAKAARARPRHDNGLEDALATLRNLARQA